MKVDTLNKKKRLYVTVGLPYSGKSTWAKDQGCPIVCPDAVRVAVHGERYLQRAEGLVWEITEHMVRALFLAGHGDVVLDATNISRRRRERWIQQDWTTRFVEMDAGSRECLRRARDVGDEYIIPIIERMAERFEPVLEEERAAGKG